MQYLRTALDDPDYEPCGQCANCLGRPLIPPDFEHETAVQATYFLRHAELPLKLTIQTVRDAFPHYGFTGNLPVEQRGEEARILSRWGDAGWGQIVANDKHNGYFRKDKSSVRIAYERRDHKSFCCDRIMAETASKP